jgi:hypothetical protein
MKEATPDIWNGPRQGDEMKFSPERMSKMRDRLTPLLKKFNPEMQLITVFADSSREYLGVVAQIEDRPLVLKFGWIDFISCTDDDLQAELSAQLEQKLEAKPAR